MGGLGIRDPTELCDVDFGSSLAGVTVVSAAIDGTTEFDWSEHLASLHAASVSRRESVNSWYKKGYICYWISFLRLDSVLLSGLWEVESPTG